MPDSDAPRRLFLLRHATASWSKPGDPDHDRPLAPRGTRALPSVAAAIDRHLEHGLDLVLASTAARTRATVDGVVPRLPTPREVRWLRPLYLATAERLLAELRDVDDDAHTVLLCGHNPGIHELALRLLDDEPPPNLMAGLPPAGLVVIDIDERWSAVDACAGALVAFVTPRQDAG